ncbi:ATP-binding protein [Ruminococcus albus]|uniref:Putative DNA-binding domain-containing protein n=1 Tax=Ruminococcus albus TaxID=1264 RepID=A0A1H7Q5A5_RUMAL|nr:ATP-binding protein [Ruminococcus albus]SEL42675.1 Putative DNA-binding domain-containing protein [Ruminococcus albus]
MNQEELYYEIIDLIESQREDDWCDFKRDHHNDKADLVHDIICMANNRANRDSYIICGIEDKSFNIIGVENDTNRRNQQNIVDILRSVSFAGSVRPRIEVRTIQISGHDIDVIIVKNSFDVPYYLEKQYQDSNIKSPEGKRIGKIVYPYHIYTRVVDNNTAIDKNADINDIEYLWKKRLGLNDTPLQLIYKLLQNPDDWEYEDDVYYHKLYPQYTIKNEFDYENEDFNELCKEEVPVMYHYVQCDSSTHYGRISIFHYSTKLYSCQSTSLDGPRALVPCPECEYLHFNNPLDTDATFRYYLEDSIDWKLLCFFKNKKDKTTGLEASIAIRRHMHVVLLFTEKKQHDLFVQHILSHKEVYYSKKEEIKLKNKIPNDIHKKAQEHMIDAYTFNTMLSELR